MKNVRPREKKNVASAASGDVKIHWRVNEKTKARQQRAREFLRGRSVFENFLLDREIS